MTSQRRGFYYKFSNDKIRWWKSVPAEQKLQWLEEANAFLRLTLSDEKKRIMERFRKGQSAAGAEAKDTAVH